MSIGQHDPLWIYPKVDPAWHQTIIKEFNIHPVTAHILARRSFSALEEIHEYLYGKLPDLLDPQLFPDMDQAVERILEALHKKEAILIYGDNDVDGMTGTALLTDFLRFIGASVFFYIPQPASREQTLLLDALDYAKANQCKLIITVDCGITSATQIEQLLRHKIDVMITDHHEPTHKLPHCIATLNPKLINSTYPNRDLTGVGVAFKLAHAVTNALIANGMISPSKIDLKRYLDLVALGTVADMGALLGENRILVRYGLRQLRKTKRVGLIKLFQLCELKLAEINTLDIASKVAPRLNSLGRIADPQKGVELLLIRDPIQAEALAQELDLNNMQRQKIERTDSDDIEKFLQKHPEIFKHKALVLASEKWHPGIIPIITARIAKQYHRPIAIIALENGIGKGSMRTIPEFPLLPHLKESAALLENFGGHDFAAGLTIRQENLSLFRDFFLKAADTALSESDIIPKIHLDAKIEFNELTFDFMESFTLLEPFGNENPPPILYCDVKQTWPPKIVGKTHLKFYLEQDDRTLEGIGFGMANKKERFAKKGLKLHLAFTPYINTFLSKTSLQLQIRDSRVIATN